MKTKATPGPAIAIFTVKVAARITCDRKWFYIGLTTIAQFATATVYSLASA